MSRWKAFWRKKQLALVFTVILFLIMFFSMLFVFLAAFLLRRLGLINADRSACTLLFLFALVSLLMGTVLSALCSRFPLAPMRELMAAADRIADGDYSVRVNLKGPEEVRRLSRKFNHMAAEIGSVEMLRNDFINHFSHEFKTPIVSIQGFAEMLELNDLTPEERTEYIHIIIEESARLTALASNILNLSKIEQQNILTDREVFNVSEQIRQAIALLDQKWTEKDIKIDLECEEHFLNGNQELLKQVWINLMDNAVKFSPEHETVEIRIEKKRDCISVSFTNQGEEIPASALAHIFDKFYQVEASRASAGNGLGLAIVQKIVRLHGGHVEADCSRPHRITFRVELPEFQGMPGKEMAWSLPEKDGQKVGR